MTDVRVPLPKPEVKGEGRVQYRCAECGEMFDPEDGVIVADRSYHVPHAPQEPPNGR